MSTTPAQIDLWRSVVTEHQRLEFKEAKIQYDNQKFYRYCVALRLADHCCCYRCKNDQVR